MTPYAPSGFPSPIKLVYVHVFPLRDRKSPVKASDQQGTFAPEHDTNHDILQPLTNSSFSLLAFINLSSQRSGLLSVSPHLAFGLFPPKHCALQCRIVCLALQLFSLVCKRIEHSDFVMYTALPRMPRYATHGAFLEHAIASIRSLLIDAFWRNWEKRCSRRCGELEGGIHCWMCYRWGCDRWFWPWDGDSAGAKVDAGSGFGEVAVVYIGGSAWSWQPGGCHSEGSLFHQPPEPQDICPSNF